MPPVYSYLTVYKQLKTVPASLNVKCPTTTSGTRSRYPYFQLCRAKRVLTSFTYNSTRYRVLNRSADLLVLDLYQWDNLDGSSTLDWPVAGRKNSLGRSWGKQL